MSGDELIVEVIEAVAEADDIEVSAVGFTLSEYIDPEVLEKLGDMEGSVWELTFRVSDHQVRISHDGTIFVDGVEYSPSTAVNE